VPIPPDLHPARQAGNTVTETVPGAGSSLSEVVSVSPQVTAGEDPFSIYRTPHLPDLEYELKNGPNSALHQMVGGNNSVYFGEQGVAADYQGIGYYANGSIRYDMRPEFDQEFSDVKFRYDWQGPDGSARYEWGGTLGSAREVQRTDAWSELASSRWR
jgi:hypothetical protein